MTAPNNGDKTRVWTIDGEAVMGVGSYTKSLPHNAYGEVLIGPYQDFLAATQTTNGAGLEATAKGEMPAAVLANPRAGLADDRLIHHPDVYAIPPAPSVTSNTTAAEMIELYWMAQLRDVDLVTGNEALLDKAAAEIDKVFAGVSGETPDLLRPGIDVPGVPGKREPITAQNLFRLGLPGDDKGPMVSQFWLRPIAFGTQTIDQRQLPYVPGVHGNYLTTFDAWLHAQNSGFDSTGRPYPKANEFGPVGTKSEDLYEKERRYLATPRDMARFVNKDALHQAYFNAALIMLSGDAKWTPGNPYGDRGVLAGREAGFGVLGGPHLLALVSEVATRALKAVWHQKWQVHLRLRPEAYGGRVQVQFAGVDGTMRDYGLPKEIIESEAAKWAMSTYGTYLLPMAFTPGSPTHPAYGAGHATVAGACVTILKAYFKTLDDNGDPILFASLAERPQVDGTVQPYNTSAPMPEPRIRIYTSHPDVGSDPALGNRTLVAPGDDLYSQLTIEGELNKLAQNVAMGRSMGGVHWRTDNARSLILGEALAAEILAGISTDVKEAPEFNFRSFARRADGKPKSVKVAGGRVIIDGSIVTLPASAL